MNRIGIIAAMEHEFDLLRNEINSDDNEALMGIEFYFGNIGNNEVVMCKCGVGKVNSAIAASLLITQYECNLIINTGIAGGVGLKTKDVVVASKLKYHDFDTTIFNYEYGQVPGMPNYYIPNMESIVKIKAALNSLNIKYEYCPIYSGDQFVSSMEQLSKINLETPCAVEMEGASIAQACIKANCDFIVLRYISDCVGEENQVNDYLAFENEMAERSAGICLELLKKL